MQKRNVLRSRFGMLAAAFTALGLTPALAQSATLDTFGLSHGAAGGGASIDLLVAVARSAAWNRTASSARFGGAIGSVDRSDDPDQFAASELRHAGSGDLAQATSRNVNPHWNRIANVNRASLFPGWARPGWGALRPWDKGWYGDRTFTPWTWLGARSRAWGVTSLASRASINKAIDNAINAYIPYIVVPKTNYKLLYGTELPSGNDSVSFVVQSNSIDYRLNANCKKGTINGREPSNLQEAELLHAACQVAYGPV